MPIHNGLLPREGLTSDPIFRFIAKTALNPALTLPLVLLARYTKKGERLRILYPKAARRLKILFYWGLVRWLSSWYSRKVLNNWVVDKSWGREWSREVAVVTGGAGGIGGCMVKLLAEKGIRVVVLDIQDMTFEGGLNVHHFKCDITSPAQISSAASQIRAKLGDPTILINNAGVARGKTILDASECDVRFTFDVNTLSHYWLAKEFVPAMVKRNHGMIVTIASFAAYFTVPNMVDYAASKAAAVAFHEGLSAELMTRYSAPRVRTVLVNQGYTKTALFRGYNNGFPFLSPTLEPETVADAVVKKIFEGNSGQVIVPSFGAMLTAMRSFPHWYQTGARVKGQDIMTKWEGRQVVEDLEKFYEAKEKSEEGESTVLVEGKEEGI